MGSIRVREGRYQGNVRRKGHALTFKLDQLVGAGQETLVFVLLPCMTKP